MDEAINSKNIVINDILLHLKDLEIVNERVYILGFSQGAILSWSIGIEHPDLIKNIIPLSGFYHPEITSNNLNISHVSKILLSSTTFVLPYNKFSFNDVDRIRGVGPIYPNF